MLKYKKRKHVWMQFLKAQKIIWNVFLITYGNEVFYYSDNEKNGAARLEIWKKRGKINGSVRAEVGDETYLIYTNSLNKYGIGFIRSCQSPTIQKELARKL